MDEWKEFEKKKDNLEPEIVEHVQKKKKKKYEGPVVGYTKGVRVDEKGRIWLKLKEEK